MKYTMLFGLWTLMVRSHTSDWYIHITLHSFEVLSKLLLIWNYFKISSSVDLQEGLPTDIPLCITWLTSLKNLCEDPFLYLKNVFLHLQSVACTYFWSLWHQSLELVFLGVYWLAVLSAVDSSCECGGGGGFYRAVSADNCRSFIQSTASGNVPGFTFHCPPTTRFNPAQCTCVTSGFTCPSGCQGV